MIRRFILILLLTTYILVMGLEVCFTQNISPVFVVYGIMYQEHASMPVDGGYIIIARNQSRGISLETDLGSGENAGKFKILFIDYFTNDAVGLGDIIKVIARREGGTIEYLCAEHIVTSVDLDERRVQIDLNEATVDVESSTWGAIKSMFSQ